MKMLAESWGTRFVVANPIVLYSLQSINHTPGETKPGKYKRLY